MGIFDIQDGDDKTKLDSIYAKYPNLRKMGEVTLHADTTFTKEKTGIGNIEYFSPDTTGRQSIIYPTGYEYAHPKPGTHGIVYNPKTNDQQSIMLDMLHGMSVDSSYNAKRNIFKTAMLDKYQNDFEYDWQKYNKESNQYNDGKEAFERNWIDGKIRGLMFEGSEEDFKKANYWSGAKDFYLKDTAIKESFEGIKKFLQENNSEVVTAEESIFNSGK